MSIILREDIEKIIYSDLPWYSLAGCTVLITGATGLIGYNLVRILRAVNEAQLLNIRLIKYTRKEYGDICSPISINEKVDYIFHCAAITKSSEMVSNPLAVIDTAITGTRNVLEFAKHKQCKGVIYISSMEVYGQLDKPEAKETDLGYLDLSNPRSCYPEGKRMAELLCNLYYSQYGIPVRIARLAQTFGAGTHKSDTRVFAQFAHSVMSGKDIVLHTEGNSRGNYCYIADTILGLITILFKGLNGQAYNISADSATIREMAIMVAGEYGVNVILDVPENIANLGYAPTVGYTLNTDKLRQLGWRPKYNLLDMYKRMIQDWSENNSTKL